MKGGQSGLWEGSEELADASDDLEYVPDLRLGEFLFVEIFFINRYISESFGVVGFAKNLNCTDILKHYGIYLTILHLFDCTFAQCYDVTMIYFGFHRVPRNVTPKVYPIETLYDDIVFGDNDLRVYDFIEAPQKVYIIVWLAYCWGI